nr:1-acyl-sn-glycerol-3-phosphate acyltransferase [uncultured Emticicia sp.]
MLYYILRPYVGFLLRFFIKKITITGLENIPKSGAVILAATHANSFLDAAIIGCNLDRRMWSLGRGDIFRKKLANKILSSFFMLPIHRLSEGKEHLSGNDETFDRCIDLFKQGEIVLIFSEGICTHQTKLLPLKKGTARLAQQAWNEGIDLTVVPIGISYDTFFSFGKIVNMNIGTRIVKKDLNNISEDVLFLKTFNDLLTEKINKCFIWSFPKVEFWQSPIFTISLVINFPANYLSGYISHKITKGSVFFDSIRLGAMIVVYPLYWFILFFVVRAFCSL